MNEYNESLDKLLLILKHWQKIEDTSILDTTEIIKRTNNPLIHLVMEIIRQDSVMHRRVQQLLIDNFEKHEVTMTNAELAAFWDMINEHNKIEKETITLAHESLNETDSPFAKYLLTYLLTDESKHDMLLENLNELKNSLCANDNL